jgi:hypothetical protein
VCVIYDVGETDDQRLFISMEFVDGETLGARAGHGGFTIPEIVDIATQVADALDAARAEGIVHRDIKASNISLNTRGQVKVLDFGLAKRLDYGSDSDPEVTTTRHATKTGQILGTPHYMSPEQALGRAVDHRTDLFSFGVVLYELVAGQLPFVGSGLGDTIDRIVHAQPEAIARFNYDAPAELERIILKCLQKDPEQRYQTPRELLIDLKKLRQDSGEFRSAVQVQGRSAPQVSGGVGTQLPPPKTAQPPEELKESDIVISCAPVDNQPFAPDKPGWISEFQRNLEVRLQQLSGETVRVAYHTAPTDTSEMQAPLPPALRRAKAMISVVSPPFVKSFGCRRVVEEFWQAAEHSGGLWIEQRPRIFKVVKTPVPQQEMPPGLGALMSQLIEFDFFERDPETGRLREFDERFGPEAHQRYFERVYDLAQEIWRVLSALRSEQGASAVAAAPLRSNRTIYLAHSSSDLGPAVDRIRRELIARGHEVLPDRPLPLVGDELEETVRELLERSHFSIHPIGSMYGVIPEGVDHSIIEIQNRLAADRAVGKDLRRIIWLPKKLEPQDARQEAFIAALKKTPEFHCGAEIIQDHLESLKDILIERLAPRQETEEQTEREPSEQLPPRIYLICDKRDEQAIEALEDFFFNRGLEVGLPDFEVDEAEAAVTHRQNLLDCDAALVFYGAARHTWVDIKLRNLLKARGYGRPHDIPAQAVYIAPPFDRRKERFRTHTADVIRPKGEFNPNDLESFVEKIFASNIRN